MRSILPENPTARRVLIVALCIIATAFVMGFCSGDIHAGDKIKHSRLNSMSFLFSYGEATDGTTDPFPVERAKFKGYHAENPTARGYLFRWDQIIFQYEQIEQPYWEPLPLANQPYIPPRGPDTETFGIGYCTATDEFKATFAWDTCIIPRFIRERDTNANGVTSKDNKLGVTLLAMMRYRGFTFGPKFNASDYGWGAIVGYTHVFRGEK